MPQLGTDDALDLAKRLSRLPALDKPAERMIIAYLSPLVGLNALLIGAIALVYDVPDLRFELGVVTAAAGSLTLARTTALGRLNLMGDALQTGAAAAALLFAILALSNPMLALIISLTAVVGASVLVARGVVHEHAAILPALYLPLLTSVLQPDWRLLLGALVPILASLGLYAMGRRLAVVVMLLSPLLLGWSGSEFAGVWMIVLALAALAGFFYQFARIAHRRSNLVAFAGEGIALLLTLELCRVLLDELEPAIWITAVISVLSVSVRSGLERRLPAERAAWTALLFAYASATSADTTVDVAIALLLIAAALQGASVFDRNRFASRIGLGIAVVGSALPFTDYIGDSFGSRPLGPLPDLVLAVSFAAAGALGLFSKRIDATPDPWWRGLIPARVMVVLRRWGRKTRTALHSFPFLGPFLAAASAGWSWVKRAASDEVPVGLPELVAIGAQLYILLVVTYQIEAVSAVRGVPVTTEQILVSIVWAAWGLCVFVVGQLRRRVYLRVTGLLQILVPIAFAMERPGNDVVPWSYLAVVHGFALMGLGVIAWRKARPSGGTPPRVPASRQDS